MLFEDRLNYGDPLTRNEFTDLFTGDPEFAFSFYTYNNPQAVLSNIYRLRLLDFAQNVYPGEVWNFIAAYLNAGRMQTVKALLKNVEVIPNGPGMSEAVLDALVDLEIQFAPTGEVLTNVPIPEPLP